VTTLYWLRYLFLLLLVAGVGFLFYLTVRRDA
jgi:hypothetical protein